MTTEQHLELLTKAVLNLTHLTAELADTLTDMHLGVLSPNESLGEDLHKSLDRAKSNALLLNDLLNTKQKSVYGKAEIRISNTAR